MKPLVFYMMLLAILIISAICPAAAENPNVGKTFGSSTNTVPSQGRTQRLLTNPNPMAASSNDVVTGNVGGLRYFHGVVPYGSRYYSNSNLNDTGTGSVSSFLRRSTDPILSDRNPTQTRVHYEPQRTVSSFYVQNGQRTALSKSVTRTQYRNDSTTVPELKMNEAIPTDAMERPLSTNNQELDKILARQFELKEKSKENARESILDSQSKFENFFKVVLEPEAVEKPEIEKPITEQPVEELLLEEPAITQQPKEMTEPQITKDQSQRELESEMTLPERLPIQQNLLEETEQTGEIEPAEGDQSTEAEEGISMEAINERVNLHAEAERIRGEHPTIKSLSEARFSYYMQAAEEFIRNGKFYKAADTYALAAVWKQEDPRPYAGQAFALFAAGEYMSSAFYLSRAIEMDPSFAEKKFDLAELIGDRDVYENRLIEMTTWQQRSKSAELAFLMAYVLYQDGKDARAIGSIQRAEEKMPDNKAVSILKNVIIPSNGTTP